MFSTEAPLLLQAASVGGGPLLAKGGAAARLAGDTVLLAGLIALAVALGAGLRVGFSGLAQCADTDPAFCSFEDGKALGSPATPILAAAYAENRTACCALCSATEGCAAASFLPPQHVPPVGPEPSCLMFDGDNVAVSYPQAGAAVCRPPEAVRVVGALAAWMDSDGPGEDQAMLGAAPLLLRCGYFIAAVVLSWLQGLCGFRGGSLPESVMAPRVAALAVRAAASLRDEPPDAALTGWAAYVGVLQVRVVALGGAPPSVPTPVPAC